MKGKERKRDKKRKGRRQGGRDRGREGGKGRRKKHYTSTPKLDIWHLPRAVFGSTTLQRHTRNSGSRSRA